MKLIDNTKIDLTNLEDRMNEAITWSYKTSQRTKFFLNNNGSIFLGIDNNDDSSSLFSFIVDYSQAEYDTKFDECTLHSAVNSEKENFISELEEYLCINYQ